MTLSRARLLPVLVLALAACAGERVELEMGSALCNDGLDNDGDQLIDCADPNCRPLAICGGTDSGPLPRDLGQRDGPPARDSGPGPDLLPQPDLPPLSSFGARCQFQGQGDKCADGISECVPTNYTDGLCTRPCAQGCPQGPAGTKVHCSYGVDWPTGFVEYCLFLCTSGATCPHGTQCFGGAFCF